MIVAGIAAFNDRRGFVTLPCGEREDSRLKE